jgi:hypothetical protein
VLKRSRRLLVLACLSAIAVAACGAGSSPNHATTAKNSLVSPLDLQVRNSGLPGGYLWLAMADQPTTGRWHRFGMAEFLCVTCPEAFVGFGASYEIAVLDESCHIRASLRTTGGKLLVDIDLGPTIRLVQAPPLQDWLPADSAPVDPATVPCARR